MKIETAQQSEETTLIVEDLLEIELKTIPGVVYIRLIPRKADRTWLIVRDWQGKDHFMPVEVANQAAVNKFLQDVVDAGKE